MAALCLPLGTPLVQTHLFHAFPLAILAGHGDAALPWILSTFVQLYRPPGGDLKFYVHPLSPAPHLRQVLASPCPCLEVQGVDPACLDGAPAAFLARCLRRGLYAQVDVDHGRLPGDDRRGFVHEVLVHGVDAAGAAFRILGYDGAGRFAARWVGAAALEAAIAAAARPGDGPRWFLYRVTGDAAGAVDVAAVAAQLWDYVEAADSSRRYRALWPPCVAAWGVAAVHDLAAALRDAAAAAHTLSLRLLWEHKRLMALRLAHLEAGGHLDPAAGAAAAARRWASQTWSWRLALLRRARHDAVDDPAGRSSPAAAVAAGLDDLVAAELDLYAPVLNRLDAARQPRAQAA